MQRRALVVDDEPAICALIQEVLSSTGIETLALTKSADATRRLQNERFDVVLLDQRMPTPSGMELAQQMRFSGFNQTTPIIMISDDPRTIAVSEGFEAGANFFIYKPLDKGRLLKLVRATRGTIEHERRRFRRVPLQSKVRLSSQKGELEGETIDVSLGGILMKASHTLPAGLAVQFSLYLDPGEKPVIGSGSVMRVIGANQMGIRLDRLSVTESAKLQEFLLPLIPPD
jgi:DNA-binding response OmpR family regulator